MTSDSPTDEALYGDLDVTREGSRFRILFRPVGRDVAPGSGCFADGAAALDAVLEGLELTEKQISTLRNAVEKSAGGWVRVLASTTILRKNALI